MTKAPPAHIEEFDFSDDRHILLPYKVSTKTTDARWRDCPRCTLNISMGHDYHEGVKLESLLYWANRRFNFVIVNIGDSLHRHNLIRQGLSPEKAHAESLKMGTDWLERNGASIHRYLTRAHKVHRWSDWLFHDNFQKLLSDMKTYYRQDKGFYDAVQSDINRFLQRQRNGLSTEAIHEASQKSADYLLEEATVYTLMARTYEANRAYPANDLDTLRYLSQPDIPAQISGLEKSLQIYIKFYKRKSFSHIQESASLSESSETGKSSLQI